VNRTDKEEKKPQWRQGGRRRKLRLLRGTVKRLRGVKGGKIEIKTWGGKIFLRQGI